jgi:hypothetical protein
MGPEIIEELTLGDIVIGIELDNPSELIDVVVEGTAIAVAPD